MALDPYISVLALTTDAFGRRRGAPERWRQLGDRPLVLVPMLSGGGALICNFDRADAVWIGYPMPGVERLLRGEPEAVREDALELLLGPVRAQVLAVLAQSRTMGELAALTELAPSAVTYHCERLAAIGLVQRERNGRQVRGYPGRRAARASWTCSGNGLDVICFTCYQQM